MEREILLLGNPQLYEVSEEVKRGELEGLRPVFEDMFDCIRGIRRDYGFGRAIAAPQIGVLRRICLVMDEYSEEYLELINPEIIAASGEQTGLEGCLSVPGKWGIVTRPDKVRVRAQNRHGEWFVFDAEGLTARCCCHEIDHLDGHLYVEHIDHFLTDEELQAYLEAQEAAMADEEEMEFESARAEEIEEAEEE